MPESGAEIKDSHPGAHAGAPQEQLRRWRESVGLRIEPGDLFAIGCPVCRGLGRGRRVHRTIPETHLPTVGNCPTTHFCSMSTAGPSCLRHLALRSTTTDPVALRSPDQGHLAAQPARLLFTLPRLAPSAASDKRAANFLTRPLGPDLSRIASA